MATFAITSIGNIKNFYGGLYVMKHEGKYYWIIEDHDTDWDDLAKWSEIEKELYDSLMAHENRRSKG